MVGCKMEVGIIRSLLFVVLQVTLATSQFRVSPGAYKVPIPQPPLFYESFVPLLYEYQVPVYKPLDITLRDWRGKCDTDGYAPSYTCPVFFHYERYLERFELDVVGRAWTDRSTNASVAPSPLLEVGDFCTRIQPHFKGGLSEEVGVEEYIQKLRECPLGELRLSRGIPDYVFNIKALFKKMNDNFEQEFSNKFFGETNKKMGPAFYVNAVTSHQNGMLVAYTMEKLRWSTASGKCLQRMIPEGLIRPENVTSAVADLNAKLGIGGLATSLPLQEVAALYTLPIADCTHVQNNGNFVVRILVPIIRRDVSPILYKVRTVPFMLAGRTCQLRQMPGRFLYEPKTGELQMSDCAENSPLCHFQERRDSVNDPCLRALFNDDILGVKIHCPLDCTPDTPSKSPSPLLFQQTLSDTWTISNASSDSLLQVKCQASTTDPEEDVEIPPGDVGALEIKLPCHCYIKHGTELLLPQSPCLKDITKSGQIRRIIPPHFVKELSEGVQVVKEADLDLSTGAVNGGQSNNAALKGGDDDIKRETVTTTDGGGGGGQLGLLWALVILQLILILVIIGFGVYRWTKYQREMRYSKERLVYNIYATPSDPNLAAGAEGNENRGSDYMNHL